MIESLPLVKFTFYVKEVLAKSGRPNFIDQPEIFAFVNLV